MKGRCYYCKNEFTKAGILKHLKSCNVAKEFLGTDTQGIKAIEDNFILAISPKYDSLDYWLFIRINKNATLKELDQFLRDVWLECCGHLSSFNINGQRYDSEIDSTWEWGMVTQDMNMRIKNVMNLNDKVDYMYDFGSTTYLEIRVVGELRGKKRKNKIEIMARNSRPSSGYTNSPRAGVCGYQGSDEDEGDYLPVAVKADSKVIPLKKEETMEDKPLLNKKQMKMLEKALLGLKQMAKESEIRKESRAWSYTEEDNTLNYHLSRLTKNELLDVTKNLYIHRVSALKKEELRGKILELYKERALYVLENMDSERFDFLLTIAKGKGIKERQGNEDWYYDYFKQKGLLFTGRINRKDVVIMPEEFQRVILERDKASFKKYLRENGELIRLFWGMCYHYGVITLEIFKDIAVKYIDYDIDGRNLETLMEDGSIYYDGFNFDGYFGSNITVEKPWHIFQEQREREELSYYPFEKTEILRVTEDDFLEDTKAAKRLRAFLVGNYNIDDDGAEDLIFMLDVNMKNDKPFNEVMSAFLDNFDVRNLDEANAITAEVVHYSNNTRQWVLKGYTSEELRPRLVPVAREVSVGRNEACPCGSGKKFKKCCGR